MGCSYKLPLVAFSATLSVVVGCSEQKISLAPQSSQLPDAIKAEGPSIVQARNAWGNFIERVERGEIKDPFGQYVSKTVKSNNTHKQQRPKYDAVKIWQYKKISSGDVTTYVMAPNPYEPDLPCGVSGPNPGPYSTFTRSEGLGGSGAIHDLKLISNSSISNISAPTGYVKLNADLNKGAGGDYIYLVFTRNTSAVLNGLEYHKGYSYSEPSQVVRDFMTKKGGFFSSIPEPPDRYFTIWFPNQNPYIYWDRIDLNSGAGGNYIYSYQSKDPSARGLGTFTQPISEIAILSGNSSTIQPPAGEGWTKWDRI